MQVLPGGRKLIFQDIPVPYFSTSSNSLEGKGYDKCTEKANEYYDMDREMELSTTVGNTEKKSFFALEPAAPPKEEAKGGGRRSGFGTLVVGGGGTKEGEGEQEDLYHPDSEDEDRVDFRGENAVDRDRRERKAEAQGALSEFGAGLYDSEEEAVVVRNRILQVSLGLCLTFMGLFLYTDCVLDNVEWCIR